MDINKLYLYLYIYMRIALTKHLYTLSDHLWTSHSGLVRTARGTAIARHCCHGLHIDYAMCSCNNLSGYDHHTNYARTGNRLNKPLSIFIRRIMSIMRRAVGIYLYELYEYIFIYLCIRLYTDLQIIYVTKVIFKYIYIDIYVYSYI